MQTKQEIEQLLAGAGTYPKHRLGQNFLIDLNLMRQLVEAAGIRSSDVVLEVGCGTGSLTEELAARSGYVVGVEYDPILCGIVQKRLANAANLTVLNGDVLESKNALNQAVIGALRKALEEYGGRLLLVSNLPYNVASSVMANLITGPLTAEFMLVTVQKEVAERMAAQPGQKAYGPLSIVMAAAGEVHFLKSLPPTVFWPRPQVDSAMVQFVRNPNKVAQIHDMELFQQIVHLFMSHRRKMLKACVHFVEGRLSSVQHWPKVFAEAFVDAQQRPENLSAADYINIANLCFEQLR
ncbi:MAG TPA: 16S rRNA (adenine(1518)-N(6)/adenine(1519)-N(6))-dimethyltransferase RsmA [Anaerohalosphaeraceae bacterium]|nr:16S rRNA (adenine(1518)-N(6)/adenine(1519)-N(6))-dimethyltransferase RsmA [Anaerohalosphaeraceae bacterium]